MKTTVANTTPAIQHKGPKTPKVPNQFLSQTKYPELMAVQRPRKKSSAYKTMMSTKDPSVDHEIAAIVVTLKMMERLFYLTCLSLKKRRQRLNTTMRLLK